MTINNPNKPDVFLCHNSKDKPLVRKIAEALKGRGLSCWIDESDIQPGAIFPLEIERAIGKTKSAVIFFGLKGEGRWQIQEIFALVFEKVEREIPLIPVLLPGVDGIPTDRKFVRIHNSLPLVSEEINKEFLDKLVKGINGSVSYDVEITLESEVRIDYTRLQHLLATKAWERADEETHIVMLKAAKKRLEARTWLDAESIKKFPCTDLRTINLLWLNYWSLD